MTKSAPLPRRMALVLMEHAAWVLPSTRSPWATAMQHELVQIGNDWEALLWAGGCVAASYSERGSAMTRRQKIIGLAAILAFATIGIASWRAGQQPFVTAGNHQIFREDSGIGALAGFFIFWLIAALSLRLAFALHDRKLREVGPAGRVCAALVIPYLAALTLVSLLTPATIVNTGDSYCMDMWCLGVNQVNATQKSQDILYTAEVAISVYSPHPHRFPAATAKDAFYVVDDQGRRYPLLPEGSFGGVDATVQPGETVNSLVVFRAPRNARNLYLAGNDDGKVHLPWFYLDFGSDISLFHRPTLLRLL